MSEFHQGNSQSSSQGHSRDGIRDNQQAAPAGTRQGGESGVARDTGQDPGIEDLAFGEVRRADRIRRDGAEGQAQQ